MIELSGREVLGVEEGKARVCHVERKAPGKDAGFGEADPIQELIIQPDDSTIAEGEHVDYQVFAKRTERLQELRPMDGLQLQTANPVIASAAKDDLRVTGMKQGKTKVRAKFGSRRAEAQLAVTRPAKPAAPQPPLWVCGLSPICCGWTRHAGRQHPCRPCQLRRFRRRCRSSGKD